MDLYVVSGGNEWSEASLGLQDRLYLNNGKGKFVKTEKALPKEIYSGSCITAADFDKDGDLDLFVGARVTPGKYPFSEGNMVLRNDFTRSGKSVHFINITKDLAGENLSNVGMVTDASWSDIDKDGWLELVIVGDYMPVKIFKNENGKRLVDITTNSGLDEGNGWWCKIIPADIDKDGDIDFIVGNMGLNLQFKVSAKQPLITYADDFNNDGKIDPITTWYIQGTSYPMNSRDELVEQMPQLNKKFLKYADFANAAINDIVGKEQAERAKKFYIRNTETSLLINNNGKFQLRALPLEAQFSTMNGILYKDFDKDGKEDILLSGNFYPFRVQQGKCDAGIGSLLKGDGKGGFMPLNRKTTGLYIQGDVRDMIEVKGLKKNVIVVSKNNDHAQVIAQN